MVLSLTIVKIYLEETTNMSRGLCLERLSNFINDIRVIFGLRLSNPCVTTIASFISALFNLLPSVPASPARGGPRTYFTLGYVFISYENYISMKI